MRKTGHYENIGNIKYFIPDSLQNASFVLNHDFASLYGETMFHIGRLNGITHRLYDRNRVIKSYIFKEALLSSSIEEIDTTLFDIFIQSFSLSEVELSKEMIWVRNYIQALYYGFSMIKKDSFPISSRVILGIHERLMQDVGSANPGHYRKLPVTVSPLNPPPANQVLNLMRDFEHYINNDQTLPPLIKAGLAHVQFEMIHPFLGGNGRIGRLLIVLMMIKDGLLAEPIIYPSYYFRKNKSEYSQYLDSVRTQGDFREWIIFFLTGIRESAIDAYMRVKDIEYLKESLNKEIIKDKLILNKMDDNKLKTLTILFNCPIINIKELSLQLGVSYNTADQIISDFIDLGILVQESQQKRGKLFKFKSYLDVLEKEYA